MNLQDNRVMLQRVTQYDVSKIKAALKEGLKPWGGMAHFVKPDDKVLLKTNLLMAKKPEEATTTHPAVVQAVAELVSEVGGKPMIGDSPGGPFNNVMLQRVYRKTGMEDCAKAAGATLNWNFESEDRQFPEARILKTVTLGKFVTEADVIINMPKMKTHGITKLSCGVKNLFGTIPGLQKAGYHLNMPDINDFSNMLIDIALCVAPQLTIMDGIVGMEGEGPSGGDPIALNSLLISPNPFAMDVAAAEMVKIKPEKVPTIKMAGERGLPSNLADIEILGGALKEFHPTSFTSPDISYSAKLIERILPNPIAKALLGAIKPKPIFDVNLCIQCGDCIRSCPPQVITKAPKGVKVELDKCIRCFCCQELCPRQAVRVHRPALGKVFFRK